MKKTILQLKNITKKYIVPSAGIFEKRKIFAAVNDISFYVEKGETVGLIGESGCGKTTVGRIAAKLLEPDSGRIFFEGEDITKMSYKELKDKRSRIQMIFQDPATALNPQFKIGTILKEALFSIGTTHETEQNEIINHMIQKVGIAQEFLLRYPHELSGGQKQRICILLALLTNPSFIVADEIVSALDLSVQAQILNLLKTLQKEYKLSMLFISHDLNIVHYMSDRIIVMYMGEIVESGSCDEIYYNGKHPYTRLLLSSLLDLNADVLSEEVKDKNGINPNDSICVYSPKCGNCKSMCTEQKPKMIEISPGHYVSCHLYNREDPEKK